MGQNIKCETNETYKNQIKPAIIPAHMVLLIKESVVGKLLYLLNFQQFQKIRSKIGMFNNFERFPEKSRRCCHEY